jgi:predicted RNase H-like HicB family nuclease
VAKTPRTVKRLIREAIQLHVEDMRSRGEPIPKPTTASELVELQSA